MIGITFNEQAFLEDFYHLVMQAMEEQASNSVQRLREDENIDWVAETKLSTEVIETYLRTINPRAFLKEFGKGSMMANARMNPWLKEYKQSPYWNKLRSKSGGAILRRGADTVYYHPDYETGTSGVRMYLGTNPKGENLEELGGIYSPYIGNFWLRNELKRFREKVRERMIKYLNDLDWSKYIKGAD